MTNRKASQSRSSRRIPLRVLLPVGCALITAGAWFGVRWKCGTLRTAAIDRIKVQQEPLMPAYLSLAASAKGQDPTEWLDRVARVRNKWDLSHVSDPSQYGVLLDEAHANRVGQDGRIAFETFDTCIRAYMSSQVDDGKLWPEFWAGVAVRLRECDGTSAWGECTEHAIQLLAAGLAPSMELARQARNYGSIDPVRAASVLDRMDESFPFMPVVEETRVAHAVHVTAIHQAQSKHARDALDSIRVGLDVARIHAPSHWITEQWLWSMHVTRMLEALQTILPMLPRGLDVGDIEAVLTAARPREEVERALKGERAFGNRVFEMMRDGWRPKSAEPFAPGSLLERLHRSLVGDADQAAYLDAMALSIDRAAHPAFLRQAAPSGVARTFWTPAASIITPSMEAILAKCDVLEARLVLARVALVAYRAGAKEALSFLGTTVDPFDGQQIRCGFGQEGLVVFWSAGPNGRDDGAKPDTDDIVWGLRLNE